MSAPLLVNDVTVVTVQVPGVQGPPGVFKLGTITTGAPGTDADADTVSDPDDPTIQVVNLTIPRGADGAVGPQGIQGIQGVAGVKGDIGPQGPAGAQGIQGIPGIKGDKGDQGIQGIAGPQGIQGPQGTAGAAGTQGPAGPANTLTIGTVSTGSAAATITGTAPNQTLNLTVPQGVQGPQGIQGIQGPAGSAGAAGTPGQGVLFLNAADPIPAGTPANTVIYRPNTIKTSSFFWGSGTAFPTSTAIASGDTFLRTDVGTNGSIWHYVGGASGVSGWVHKGFVTCTSTTRPTATYSGMQIYETDTGLNWQWSGTAWASLLMSGDGTTFELPYGTGWSGYKAAPWTGVRYWKRGGVVTVAGPASSTAAVAANGILGTLPVGFRPPIPFQTKEFNNAGGFTFNADGTVVYSTAISGSGTIIVLPVITFGVA